MDQLLEMKDRAADAAIWPLGRPSDAYEAPLWQNICREWVAKVMRPVCVTYMIDELIRHTDPDDPDTTHHEIRKAIEESGNWQEVVEAAGWRGCDEIANEAATDDKTLVRVVNLAMQSCTTDEPPDEDCRFYWVRRVPTWSGDDQIVMVSEIVPWETVRDADADERQRKDAQIAIAFGGTEVDYELCFVSPTRGDGTRLRFSAGCEATMSPAVSEDQTLSHLQEEYFGKPSEMFAHCRSAILDWVCRQWLEPHGFVNFDRCEWSSETEWHLLGASEDLGGEVTRNEIAQWFLVSETAGEHFKATGGVVVPLIDSSYMLWGRKEGGQVLHFDGAVQRAMIRSGYLDRVPPLGFLNRKVADNIPGLWVTLGGEEYPFRLEGFGAINAVAHPEAERYAQSIMRTLIAPYVLEAGWGVRMGPSFESDMLGPVYTFKIVDPRELEEDEG